MQVFEGGLFGVKKL